MNGIPAKYILPVIKLMWEDILPKSPNETENTLFSLIRQYLDYGITKQDFLELATKVQSQIDFVWEGYLILFSHLHYGQFNNILEGRGCSFQQTVNELLAGKDFTSWQEEETYLKNFKKNLVGINNLVNFGYVPKENVEWWINFLKGMAQLTPYQKQSPINTTLKKMAEGMLNVASNEIVKISNEEYLSLLNGEYPFLERFRYLGVTPKIKFSEFGGEGRFKHDNPTHTPFGEGMLPVFGEGGTDRFSTFNPYSNDIDVIGQILVKLLQEWAIGENYWELSKADNPQPKMDSFKYMWNAFPYYSF